MIGWNTPASSPDIDLHSSSSVPGSLQLAQLFADVITDYNLDLTPLIIPNGTGASDHAAFWTYGYPAILGIEAYWGGDFNPYYHTTNDLLEKLDIGYFTEFVKASVGSFAHMSGCLVDGASGTLEGTVIDADTEAPIAGATVEMVGDNSFEATTNTDAGGYYSQTLWIGTYTVTVSAENYLPGIATGVTILTDTVTMQDFALQPEIEDTSYLFLPVVARE
jgi:hypothetical protein